MIVVLTALSLSLSYSCPALFAEVLFSNLYSSSYGGAIYISSIGCNLTISNCIFANNSCVSDGGAVYFDGAILSCSDSCFTNCWTTTGDNALSCTSSNAIFNRVEFSLCGKNSGIATLEVVTSTMNYSSFNSSSNNAYYTCSALFTHSSSYCYGFMCSFLNDTDITQGATIDIQGAANPQQISYCNFIGNRPKSLYGFIWLDNSASYVSFSNCYFADNGEYSIVKIGSGGSVAYPTFSNCAFDVPSSRLSPCNTVSCSFGVSNGTAIDVSLLDHRKCDGLLVNTDAFTVLVRVRKDFVVGLSILLLAIQ